MPNILRAVLVFKIYSTMGPSFAICVEVYIKI